MSTSVSDLIPLYRHRTVELRREAQRNHHRWSPRSSQISTVPDRLTYGLPELAPAHVLGQGGGPPCGDTSRAHVLPATPVDRRFHWSRQNRRMEAPPTPRS